jgi:ligand-binding sensor domain-containing protein
MPSKKVTKYPQPTRVFYGDSDGLPSSSVNALLSWRREIWAGTDTGIARLKKGKWEARSDRGWPGGSVEKLFASSRGEVIAGTEGQTMMYAKGRWSGPAGPTGMVAAAEDQSGTVWALASDGLWSQHGGKWELRKRNDDGIPFTDFIWQREGRGIASSRDGILFLQGKRLYWYIVQARGEGLVSNEVRALCEDEWGHAWFATDRGISIYRPPKGWCTLAGPDGLPIESLTGAQAGRQGELWFGSDNGLMRLKEGRWNYYASKRYLPDDRVLDILPGRDGDVWVATPGGISHIVYKEMSLLEKAQCYADVVERYHKRRGYVTIKWLEEPANLSSGHIEISDNDGTWTGLYLAYLSFRYAVTKERALRPLISESLEAMLANGHSRLPGSGRSQ